MNNRYLFPKALEKTCNYLTTYFLHLSICQYLKYYYALCIANDNRDVPCTNLISNPQLLLLHCIQQNQNLRLLIALPNFIF